VVDGSRPEIIALGEKRVLPTDFGVEPELYPGFGIKRIEGDRTPEKRLGTLRRHGGESDQVFRVVRL
jgi:hypothetical protein